MTTAATITANLVLNSSQYQRGLKTAGVATTVFQSKVKSLIQTIQRNAVVLSQIGDGLQNLGKKMTTFITIPIIGFFALLIKKAMEADTALAKTAQESVKKLNDQLAILGEKFLPMVIKLVDFLTGALEKFNNAPPYIQKIILVIIALLALAGPVTSFVGSLISVIATLSTMGGTLASIIPTIIAFGASLWAALLPLLPVLALIAAAILLVYLLWKNWDQLGVIVKQLWFIIKWAFEQGWNDIKAKTKAGLDWFNREWEKSTKTWENNQRQWNQIQTKLFQLAMQAMQSALNVAMTKMTAKINEVKTWAVNAWNYISSAFQRAFGGIANFANSVFQSIVNGINWVIGKVRELIDALEDIVLPDELQPGSPTPFEMGLRGIAKAMHSLSRESIPQFNQAFAAPSGVSTVGTGKTINIVDNRRFGAGMDAKTLRLALDERLQGLTAALEKA